MFIREIFVEYMYWEYSAEQSRHSSIRPDGAYIVQGEDRQLNLFCDRIYKTLSPDLIT